MAVLLEPVVLVLERLRARSCVLIAGRVVFERVRASGRVVRTRRVILERVRTRTGIVILRVCGSR